jgi:chloride channel protein, CIC family
MAGYEVGEEAGEKAVVPSGRLLMRLALVSAASGMVTGVIGAAFRLSLERADSLRNALIEWTGQWPAVGWVIPVTMAAVLVAVAYWLVQRFAPIAAGSGVQHVEAVMRGEAEHAPLSVLPVKFIGGVLAIGSGLALGREGPTVQMGATIGAQLAKRTDLDNASVRFVQSAAAGAGLGVAFNAPLGGITFVFEELARRFSTELMVATLASCATAVLVARAILGDDFDFVVGYLPAPTGWTIGASLLLGILLGLLGAAYNKAIIFALDRFAALSAIPGVFRAGVVGAVVGLIAWFEPNLVGGGDPLIQAALDARLPLSTLAVVFVVRWLLGPFSYSAGTPGGLFAPLLVVGAVSGAIFAQIAANAAPAQALSPTMFAIIGMAAFFAAVVRAPLTGTLLVLGMTGTIAPLAPVLVACLAATIVPGALGSAPIYDVLRERMEHRLLPASTQFH